MFQKSIDNFEQKQISKYQYIEKLIKFFLFAICRFNCKTLIQ